MFTIVTIWRVILVVTAEKLQSEKQRLRANKDQKTWKGKIKMVQQFFETCYFYRK